MTMVTILPATHICDSLALLVDAPHLPDAVAIAGRVLDGIHVDQLGLESKLDGWVKHKTLQGAFWAGYIWINSIVFVTL